MLALTVSLGVWQLQRLQWKRAILADIAAGEAAAPVPLTLDPPPFRRVVAHGTYDRQSAAEYGAEVYGGKLGSHVLAVLRTGDAGPVLVDRGWAPSGFDPQPPSGPVVVVGYVLPPASVGWTGVRDDVAGRRFYRLDPVSIGAAVGEAQVAPFTLVALGSPEGVPQPASVLPRPPNDHLNYALTWFGLGIALICVFAAYVWQSRARPSER